MLDNLKGLYLIDDRGDILMINDFEVEVVKETPPETPKKTGYFIRKKDKVVDNEPKKKYYLTKLEVHGYNFDLKFIGTYNEDWCKRMISMQEDNGYNFSLTKLRKKFVKLEEQLKAFGFTLQYPVVDTTCHCDDPIVQQDATGNKYCTKCEMNIPEADK